MPKFALSDMEYDEVSFVTRGADQDAKIVIYKRDFSTKERDKMDESGDAMPGGRFPIKSQKDLDNAVKLMGQAEDEDAVKAHIKAMAKKHNLQLPESWGDMAKNLDPKDLHYTAPMPNRKKNHMDECQMCGSKMKVGAERCPGCGARNVKKTLQDWGFVEVGVNKTTVAIYDRALEVAKSLVEVIGKDGSNKASIGEVVKSFAGKVAGECETWISEGIEKSDYTPDSDVVKRFSDAREFVDSVVGKKTDPPGDDKVNKEDEILKSLPPAVREHVEAIRKRADDAEALARAASEAVIKSEEARKENEWISKAASDFTHIAGTPDEIGKSLRAAERTMKPEDFSTLLKSLASAEEVAKQSTLFREKGRVGVGGSDAGSKIDSAVAELRKTDSKLSKEQAYARVLEADPSLYEEYLRDSANGGAR